MARASLETPEEREARIAAIRTRVVEMYSRHPWPGTRRTDEEMGWRLRVLGVRPEDYRGRSVVDLGCGTGEYALWYATHGARQVTGVDLSEGSLARAREQAAHHGVGNVAFVRQDVLALDFPDETFDYAYSVGVLHHTGDPFRGFREMVRVTRPGGIVIVSLYNAFTRSWIRAKQTVCRWLGGDDIDARARWGRRLFPLTMWSLNRRYHGLNYEAISYDVFGFPHESLHTAGEVLNWFDRAGVSYIGSFAPLRLQDYLFAFSLPEYRQFRATFAGFPVMRLTADALAGLARRLGARGEPPFPRPSRLQALLCQTAWVPFSTRFNCFTIAGRRRASPP
ncbi:MAG: class I SAM-dependent methyltransferase [Armatimonadota bacterium]|nr:class I SAM-dependent methyltransferase [Armatimonadota bacterium]MDR7528902.1 class I SAM-dependent methyltransferase [Armatimonadota bacterium]